MKGNYTSLKNQPCLSPNPDLYNRNQIKNTTVNIKDIQTKMTRLNKLSQKYQNDSILFQLNENMINPIEIYQQYNAAVAELNKIKIENKKLSSQNAYLSEQIQRCKPLVNQSKNIQRLNNFTSKNDNEDLIQKLACLTQDKKSLQKQLQRQKSKNEQCLKNIDALRLQALRYEFSLKVDNKNVRQSKNKQMVRYSGSHNQQSRLAVLSNQIIKKYQQKMNSTLENLNMKIMKVEMLQKIIKEQTSRMLAESKYSKTPSSIPHSRKHHPSSKRESIDQQSKQKQEPISYPLSISPYRSHQSHQRNHKVVQQFSTEINEITINSAQRNEEQKRSEQEQFRNQQKRQIVVLKQKIRLYQNQLKEWEMKYKNKLDQLRNATEYFNQNQKELFNKSLCKEQTIQQLSSQLQKLKISNSQFIVISGSFNQQMEAQQLKYQQLLKEKDIVIEENVKECRRMKEKYDFVINELGNCMKMLKELKEEINTREAKKMMEESMDYCMRLEQRQQNLITQQQALEIEYRTKLLLKDQIIVEHETSKTLQRHELQLIRAQLKDMKEKRTAKSVQSKEVFLKNDQIQSEFKEFWEKNLKTIDVNNNKILNFFLSIKGQKDGKVVIDVGGQNRID